MKMRYMYKPLTGYGNHQEPCSKPIFAKLEVNDEEPLKIKRLNEGHLHT